MITNSSVRRAGAFAFAMTAVTGALLAATAGSSAAKTATVPPANATAEAVTEFGGEILRYTGLNGANTVTLDLTGGRYRIIDTAPITAGTGCLVSKADAGQFAVLCKAPTKADGALQTVRFDLAGGNDVVTNRTAAPIRADGGDGNDTLNGGPANDLLTDSRGSDRLRGNGGSDSLFTDGPADSAPDVLDGGACDDDLRANAGSDRLLGGDGSDVLRGGLGADDFDGGLGWIP
jgi:Ca2+-binding RTX toxin-like protein